MKNKDLTKRQLEVLQLVTHHQPIGHLGIMEIESPEMVGNSRNAKLSSISQVLKRLVELGLLQTLETNSYFNKDLTQKYLSEGKTHVLTKKAYERTDINFQDKTEILPVKAEETKPTKEPKISTLNFEESIEVFQVYKSAEKHSQWKQAEIAYHVSTKSKVWGESSLKTFAESVGIGYEYARLLSKTFEAFKNPSDRIDELSFSHHRTVALHSPNPVEDIRESGEWSVRQLESHIKDKYAKLLPSGKTDEDSTETQETEKGLYTRAVTMKKETVKKVDKLKEILHEPNPDKVLEKIVDDFVTEESGDFGVKICVMITPELQPFYKTIQDYLHGADEQEIFEFSLKEVARRIDSENNQNK